MDYIDSIIINSIALGRYTATMKIKTLQFVTAVETITGVYRNFSNYKKITQFLIVLRLFAEILIAIVNLTVRSYYGLYDENAELFYIVLSTAYSAILLPLVCWTSSNFQKLLENIETQQKYFEKNNNNFDKLDKKHKLMTCFIGSLIMVNVCIFIIFWLQHSSGIPYISQAIFYVLQMDIYVSDLRYIYEFMAINCIIDIIAQQLSSITVSIDEEIAYIERVGDLKVKYSDATQYRINLLDKWSQAYRNLNKTLNIFNTVFNFQLSVMLLSTFFYYILLLYSMTSLSVFGIFTPARKFPYVSTLLTYLTVMYLVSLAAQQCENNYLHLRRRLSALLLHCVNEPECRRATRDLLRVVITRPFHIKAYGGVAVDMSLLPNFIALCTSYAYVALQFNKVI